MWITTGMQTGQVDRFKMYTQIIRQMDKLLGKHWVKLTGLCMPKTSHIPILKEMKKKRKTKV